MRPSRTALCATVLALVLAGCNESSAAKSAKPAASPASPTAKPSASSASPADTAATSARPLPGMPPVLDPNDIYAADHPNLLSDTVKGFPSRVYVPNGMSNTVDVIDPATFKIVDHYPVGRLPQHVTPSYDLKKLWVLNNDGNTLTPIDPATGKPGPEVTVDDPYNMYYTADGKYAVVVAEARERLDFRDPETMKLDFSLNVPCKGVDHMDFSADGRYVLASCEFAGKMIKVDMVERKLLGELKLGDGTGSPQDVKLSPDGKVFYVADMKADGLYEIDGEALKVIGFLPTGKGVHGLYVSRDSTMLYASNRGEGSVSVVSFANRQVVTKWVFPGGIGSPDMGGVSIDGKVLWLSGRYNSEVYAIDTDSGKMLAKIKVGRGPHGLSIFPQPGRYSLGHTGVFR